MMAMIYVIGSRGKVRAVPFECTSADTEPEVNTSEEEQIFNYVASDTDEESNQASAPHK